MPTKFDELNKLKATDFESWEKLNDYVGFKRSMPFKEYFGEMGITKAEKRRRGVFAEKLEEEIIFLLAFLFYMKIRETGIQDISEFTKKISDEYIKAYGEEPDPYIIQRAEALAIEIMLTTVRHNDDPYYYSADRARLIAEEEANTAINHAEYEASKSKFAFKTWNTMGDERVRPTHVPLDGETVPINQPFQVGDSLMNYPRDASLGADMSEIVGCRCWLTFS